MRFGKMKKEGFGKMDNEQSHSLSFLKKQKTNTHFFFLKERKKTNTIPLLCHQLAGWPSPIKRSPSLVKYRYVHHYVFVSERERERERERGLSFSKLARAHTQRLVQFRNDSSTNPSHSNKPLKLIYIISPIYK